jgi:hypothetical protein
MMTRASRFFAAALFACVVTAVAALPAKAQFAPEPEAKSPPPAEHSQMKRGGSRAGPDINGTWVGELTQIGTTTPYKFEIAFTGRGMETKYPDLKCTGKLTRVGSSKSYAFFIELITQGHVDKGGRCPDGTITVARSADKLAVGWFGSVKENTIVAFGTLAKK